MRGQNSLDLAARAKPRHALQDQASKIAPVAAAGQVVLRHLQHLAPQLIGPPAGPGNGDLAAPLEALPHPPAELGIHPVEGKGPTYETGTLHQFTLVCDDITKTAAELKEKGIVIPDAPEDQGWGISVTLALPGGLEVLLYQPKHPVAV